MRSFVVFVMGLAQAATHPAALPHAWGHMLDSQIVVQGLPITVHHYLDFSSASILPETGYRRIWEKHEWHPPKGKGLASAIVYVEMDCTGHRSRNLAYEDSEVGFMDNDKDATWDPIKSGSLEWALCTIPAAEFVTKAPGAGS